MCGSVYLTPTYNSAFEEEKEHALSATPRFLRCQVTSCVSHKFSSFDISTEFLCRGKRTSAPPALRRRQANQALHHFFGRAGRLGKLVYTFDTHSKKSFNGIGQRYTVINVVDVVSLLASFYACYEPQCDAGLVQFASKPTPHEINVC